MKNGIKYILHKLLGFNNYLFVFSAFKVFTLKWDKKENDFFYFLDHVTPEDTVLDIGANIGIMSVHMSRKASKVIAFEPVPENIFTLKRILTFFKVKNILLHEIALGDRNGDIEMVMPQIGAVKMQGLSHVVDESIKDFNEGIKYKVSLQKLDAVEGLSKEKITAIKIDVENYEYPVLKGAEELIRKNKPMIYIELWDNENRQNCFRFIKELGYEIKVLVNGSLTPFDRTIHNKQNFFFVPNF